MVEYQSTNLALTSIINIMRIILILRDERTVFVDIKKSSHCQFYKFFILNLCSIVCGTVSIDALFVF